MGAPRNAREKDQESRKMDIINKAKEAMENVKEAAGEAVDKVKEMGDTAVDKANEMGAGGLLDKAKEIAGNAAEGAVNMAEKVTGKDLDKDGDVGEKE